MRLRDSLRVRVRVAGIEVSGSRIRCFWCLSCDSRCCRRCAAAAAAATATAVANENEGYTHTLETRAAAAVFRCRRSSRHVSWSSKGVAGSQADAEEHEASRSGRDDRWLRDDGRSHGADELLRSVCSSSSSFGSTQHRLSYFPPPVCFGLRLRSHTPLSLYATHITLPLSLSLSRSLLALPTNNSRRRCRCRRLTARIPRP